MEHASIEVLYTLKPPTEVEYQIVKGIVREKRRVCILRVRARMRHMFIDSSMESREKYSEDADSTILEDVSSGQLVRDDMVLESRYAHRS